MKKSFGLVGVFGAAALLAACAQTPDAFESACAVSVGKPSTPAVGSIEAGDTRYISCEKPSTTVR